MIAHAAQPSAFKANEAKLRKTMDKPVDETMTSPFITSLPTTPLRGIAGTMGKNALDRVRSSARTEGSWESTQDETY